MNKTEEMLKLIDANDYQKSDAYNIRSDGKTIDRKISPYINIESKDDKNGINVYIKDETKFGIIHIPVILTKSGLKEVVYNDFYIGKNANVIILAGCGIHNDLHKDSEHDGIHRFFLSENAKVKYVEKHFGEGKGSGKKTLNPVTEIYMKPNSSMTIDSSQFKGVDDTLRVTKAYLDNNTTLTINEKIFTNNSQNAKSEFLVELNGENASTKITSRSIATEDSYQEFKSNIIGNNKCYAHVSCDAMIKDNGKVLAIPEIFAKNVDANLIHEASIGKIAGDQLIKLMTLGLSKKEAEEAIIKGFLK